MSPFEKLLMKKKEQGMSMDPLEQKAKMRNLEDLRDEMSGMMKGELQPKAKVEVASDSPEGLKEGLDKAKDVVEGSPDVMGAADGIPEDHEAIDDDDMSPGKEDMPLSHEELDQLQSLIARLKQQK